MINVQSENQHAKNQDILKGLSSEKIILVDPEYDCEEFQSEKIFTFSQGNTIKRLLVDGQQQLTQTDLQFIHSVEQVCWQKYGLKRREECLTDDECQILNETAVNYVKSRSLDKLSLICSDLLNYQYLTYDITFFFLFMKVLFLNALAMSIGYTIPAMYYYGKGNRYRSAPLYQCSADYCLFIDQHSMYNEPNPVQTFRTLQLIGFGLIGVTQILYFFVWKYNKQIREIMRYQQRCSESSFLLKGLPQGAYNEKDVLDFIKEKWMKEEGLDNPIQNKKQSVYEINFKIKPSDSSEAQKNQSSAAKIKIEPDQLTENPFKIRSIQITYDFHEAKDQICRISTLCQEIWQLLSRQSSQANNHFNVILNEQAYMERKEQIRYRYRKLYQWRAQFIQNVQSRKKYSLASVFLHFENRDDRDQLLNFMKKFYTTEWIISWGNFQASQKKPSLYEGHNNSLLEGYQLKVGLAPQPDNIIWDKVEHTYDQWAQNHGKCRILMVIVPLIYVGMLIALEILKTQVVKKNFEDTTKQVLSVLISVGINLVNAFLWVFLEIAVSGQQQRIITAYQVYKNYAGFAGTALSIIFAPIAINYLWNGNYFGSEGVAGTAYEYQLSAIFAIPLMALQPGELVKNIIMKIKCLRNIILRYRHSTEEGERMRAVICEYQEPEFDISATYSFLMANFLHCTFFCMVCPIIIPFFTIQVFMFYWVCKLRLLKFCKFPQLIRRWLLGIVFANLIVSPIFFIAGYVLSVHAYQQKTGDRIDLPIGIILLSIWVFLFAGIALCADKWLDDKKIFKWMSYKDDFTNLEDLQKSRNKVYPSKSTSYYIGNNMLNLFGFEKAILGTIRDRKAQQVLKMFCQAEVNGKQRILKQKVDQIIHGQ